MFCPQCGNNVGDGAAVCSRCGTQLAGQPSPAGAAPGAAPGGPPGYPPAPPPGYPQGGQAGPPPGGQPGYAPSSPPGYAPGQQPGYASGQQAGYPPAPQSGYAPGSQPGYGPGGGPAASPPPGGPMGHTPGSGQAFRFDAKRWTRNDQIVGVASLVLMISLFLPWFSASVSAGSFGSASDSASGTSVHGWLWLVFVIGLLILAYLVAFAGFAMERISLPLRHELLLLVATGLNLLLVLIAFFDKPGGGSVLGT